MAELGGLTPEQQSRIGAMLSWYENTGRYLGGAGQRPQPVRMDSQVTLCKASSTISASCGGSVEMWRSTAASTVAETAQGTTFTAYDWFGSGASTGDKLFAFRETRSGRYYFIKPGGGAYAWYGRGTWGSSGSTADSQSPLVSGKAYLRIYSTAAIPASCDPVSGISLSSDRRELIFAGDGNYQVFWNIHADVQKVTGSTGSSEWIQTVVGQIEWSTGSTVFYNRPTQIRFSLARITEALSGDALSPEANGSETVIVPVKANHRLRFAANVTGYTSKLQVSADAHTCILKLANAEAYASTS